jgi:putative intracellular protease/amidase
MKKIHIVLFDDFAVLDVFGPAAVFSCMKDWYEIGYYSVGGGVVPGSAGMKAETEPLATVEDGGILFLPGGMGTRRLVHDTDFIAQIKRIAEHSENVLCVCTGSVLLAGTGLLDGRKATSNKLAWDWVTTQNRQVDWIKKARWVTDGKYYTSSGVAAGIDMSLGFTADQHGTAVAEKISRELEYVWNRDRNDDVFAL